MTELGACWSAGPAGAGLTSNGAERHCAAASENALPQAPLVIPAQAGIQESTLESTSRWGLPAPAERESAGRPRSPHWIPACAGMTGLGAVLGVPGCGSWIDFNNGAEWHCAAPEKRRRKPHLFVIPAQAESRKASPQSTSRWFTACGSGQSAGRPFAVTDTGLRRYDGITGAGAGVPRLWTWLTSTARRRAALQQPENRRRKPHLFVIPAQAGTGKARSESPTWWGLPAPAGAESAGRP